MEMIEKPVQDLARALAALLTSISPSAPPPSSGSSSLEPWVTVAQAAAHAGVQSATVRGWIAAGAPAIDVGRSYRLKLSELDGWLRVRDIGDPDPEPSDLTKQANDILSSLE